MAAQDADIKRQKQQQSLAYLNQLGQASSISQDVATQNFQKQILAEQALGQAKSDWMKADLQRKQQNKEMLVSGAGALLNVGASAAGTEAGGAAIASLLSDIRLKKNIVYSHNENGHKIYEFEYINQPSVRYSGVMAQEVMKMNPDAVIEESGYYKVNYDMLGLTMKKLN